MAVARQPEVGVTLDDRIRNEFEKGEFNPRTVAQSILSSSSLEWLMEQMATHFEKFIAERARELLRFDRIEYMETGRMNLSEKKRAFLEYGGPTWFVPSNPLGERMVPEDLMTEAQLRDSANYYRKEAQRLTSRAEYLSKLADEVHKAGVLTVGELRNK